MFCKKRSHDHSHTIMHKSRLQELSHARINDRVTGFPFTPCIKLLLIISPPDILIFRFECMTYYMRKMPEYHLIKITPYKLIQKCFAKTFCFSCQFTDTDRAKSQV